MDKKRMALITGASGGIGAEYARVFARKGHDLVLVARTKEKLLALKQELEQDHQISITVLSYDLIAPEARDALYQEIKDRGIGVDVLVNNAGFGDHGAFLDSCWEKQRDMVELNIIALMHLSYLFAADMRKTGFGRILNTASAAAFCAGPYMATYYASKAFVLSFSQGLAEELRGSGVRVVALCPGPVATGFEDRAGTAGSILFSRPLLASPKRAALTGYRALKMGRTTKYFNPIAPVADLASRILPRLAMRKIAMVLNGRTRTKHGDSKAAPEL